MCLGEHATKALTDCLAPENLPNGKLYWNIANRTIKPLLKEVHRLVIDLGATVMEAEDKRIGIRLQAVRTKFPEARIDDLIGKLVTTSEKGTNE